MTGSRDVQNIFYTMLISHKHLSIYSFRGFVMSDAFSHQTLFRSKAVVLKEKSSKKIEIYRLLCFCVK